VRVPMFGRLKLRLRIVDVKSELPSPSRYCAQSGFVLAVVSRPSIDC
jgi:hypothetical protein